MVFSGITGQLQFNDGSGMSMDEICQVLKASKVGVQSLAESAMFSVNEEITEEMLVNT